MRGKMRTTTKNIIKEILADYPSIDRLIQERKEEILHPVHDVDENVGGGKSNVPRNVLEHRLLKIADDERIQALKREKEVIARCYNNADDDTQVLIKALYFDSKRARSIDSLIAQGDVYIGKTAAYKLQNAFIEKVASELRIKYM